jgi:hypothetical protein
MAFLKLIRRLFHVHKPGKLVPIGYGHYLWRCSVCGKSFTVTRCLLPFLLAWPLSAAPITASWLPAPLATSYKLQLSWPGSPTNVASITTTNVTATYSNGLPGVTYTVQVFSIRTWVENGVTNGQMGEASAPIHDTVPEAPNALQIMMKFESAPEPGGPWTNQSNLVMYVATSAPNKFYRGRMVIQQQ